MPLLAVVVALDQGKLNGLGVAVDGLKFARRTDDSVVACGHIHRTEAGRTDSARRISVLDKGVEGIGGVVVGHVDCTVHAVFRLLLKLCECRAVVHGPAVGRYEVELILQKGTEAARERAKEVMHRVRKNMKLDYFNDKDE